MAGGRQIIDIEEAGHVLSSQHPPELRDKIIVDHHVFLAQLPVDLYIMNCEFFCRVWLKLEHAQLVVLHSNFYHDFSILGVATNITFGQNFCWSTSSFRIAVEGGATFKSNEHKGVTSFSGAKFDGSAGILYSHFKDRVFFDGITGHGRVVLDSLTVDVGATFDGTDLTNFTFQNDRLDFVSLRGAIGVASTHFLNVVWAKDSAGGPLLLEEALARETGLTQSFKLAESLCREIRRSLETHKQFAEGERFAAQELEIRRRCYAAKDAPGHPVVRWMRRWFASPEAVYGLSSRYGTSITRPLLAIACLLVLSPVILSLAGISLSGDGGFYHWIWDGGSSDPRAWLDSYWRLFVFAVRSAYPLSTLTTPNDARLNWVAQAWVMVVGWSLVPFGAVMTYAWGRRFFR